MIFHPSRLARIAAAATLFIASVSASARSTSAVSGQLGSPLPPIRSGNIVPVTTEAELQAAIASLTSDTTIVIAPGTYTLTAPLSIRGPLTNVGVRGATENRDDVVLVGGEAPKQQSREGQNGISVVGTVQNLVIANLTIRDVSGRAIALSGGVERPIIRNVHLVNAGRESINATRDGKRGGVDDGVVEYSLIEYTNAAGDASARGIEVAGGKGWVIRSNAFRNIKATSGIAGPAVLMWQGSRDSLVDGNAFIDCQREIAFGLEQRTPNDHEGGIIRNNFIVRDPSIQARSAIQVADSPNTQILHNTILANGTSASLIEYRFADTEGVAILNNLLDGEITARDDASGLSADNYTKATAAMFANPSVGDLHLVAGATEVMDRVGVLTDAANDVDGQLRPQAAAADYGADEYLGPAPVQPPPAPAVTTTTGTTSSSTPTNGPSVTTKVASGSSASTAPPPTGLPAPWDTADIGNPGKAGAATWASPIFTVKGGGMDIGGNADQFRFVYQTLDGDGEIIACVDSLDRTSPWAKAALMFRDELTAGAKYAAAIVTPDKGLLFQLRIATDASTTQRSGGSGKAPEWLKVKRTGNTFTVSSSADGSTWVDMGSEDVYLQKLAYVGMAVTSRANRTLTTATFENPTVTGGGTPNGPANQPPTVSVTAPANGATFTTPANITVSASASDSDGTVTNVDFYADGSMIGSATASPYSITWSNAPAGTHVITAVARDDVGASTTSAAVNVTVGSSSNVPPTVSITAPGAGASFTAPATIALTASASDADGTIARVDFYAGPTQVGSSTSSPFTATWTGVAAGSYTLTAVARDNAGASTTSTAVPVTVTAPNQPPTVSITAPTAGSTFTAPATMTLTASAADADGTVARVDFYAGSNLVGSSTSSPFATTWSGVAAGSYTLTAVARDNGGAATTSAAVIVNVTAPNQPPSVSITAPTAGASFTAPATITLSADAADADGTIARVDFYAGSTVVGSSTSSPYGATWSSVPAGSYVLTAIARDNNGATTTSAGVAVTVSAGNQKPTVSLTAPTSGATFTAPANITLSANASDPDGSITTVDFYAGTTLIGTDATSPYSLTWSNVAAGTYSLTAVARDNIGATTTSAAVSITVRANTPPTVSLTSPAAGATFTEPATVTLSASAADSDGTITRVDFYAGSTLLGSSTASPYTFSWTNVTAGSYTLMAVARDNSGSTTTSAAVTITVAAAPPGHVVFTASTDNATVASYTVEFFTAGANPSTATPIRTQNVGKPTPVNGDITVDVASTILSFPAGTYFSTVSATNSGGSTRSAPSANFVR